MILMHQEKFMVVSSGIKDKVPYSLLKLVRQGKKRDTGEAYAFLTDVTIKEVEQLELGQIITYERKRTDFSKSTKFPTTKATE